MQVGAPKFKHVPGVGIVPETPSTAEATPTRDAEEAKDEGGKDVETNESEVETKERGTEASVDLKEKGDETGSEYVSAASSPVNTITPTGPLGLDVKGDEKEFGSASVSVSTSIEAQVVGVVEVIPSTVSGLALFPTISQIITPDNMLLVILHSLQPFLQVPHQNQPTRSLSHLLPQPPPPTRLLRLAPTTFS